MMSTPEGGQDPAEQAPRARSLRESVAAMGARARDVIDRAPLRTLAFLILPLAAVPRLWQMIADQGVFWPDEIFQTVEQAHRFAFGYGWTPWEFRDGARSWVFPGLVGVVLKIASLLGLTKSGVGVVMTVRTLMIALALAGVHASMRIGEKLGGMLGALLAGTMIALCPALLVYGTRCMSEMASGPLLAIAVVLVMSRSEWRCAVAGVLAVIAIFFRYQNGLFALALFVMLIAVRARKAAGMYALAGVIGAVVGGMLDWLTWGKPFHSFFVYINFNLIEGKASRWGVDAFDYYLQTVSRSFGPALWIVLLGFVLSFARARVLPLVCIANFVIHSAIPHKEYRFLMPMMPIALGLAGGGLGWLLGGGMTRESGRVWTSRFQRVRARFGGWVATGLAIALGILFARKTQTITFADMGQFRMGREDGWAPWNHEAGPNVAYWEAGKHDDLCGIVTLGTPLISAGGYTYLHKDVPMLGSLSHADIAATNYIAAPRLTVPPPGYSLVRGFSFNVPVFARTDGKKMPPPDYDYVLFRREGTCSAPPAWWTPNFP